MKKILTLFILSLATVGCVSQKANAEAPVPTPTKQTEQVAQPSTVNLAEIAPETTTNEGLTVIPAPRERSSEAKLLHLTSLDLSKRLGIDISAVFLIKSTSITWNDGSLGCPAEGKDYTQAQVNGYKIILEAQGGEYIYHSKGLNDFIWCDGGNPMPPLDDSN